MAATNVQAFSGDVELNDRLTINSSVGNIKKKSFTNYNGNGTNRYWKVASGNYDGTPRNHIKMTVNIHRVDTPNSTHRLVMEADTDALTFRPCIDEHESGSPSSPRDLRVYKNTSDTTFDIYIQATSYSYVDVEMTYSGSGITVYDTPTWEASEPTTSGTYTLEFTNGNLNAMKIDNDGNVGIGTNTPDTQLEIKNGAPGTLIGLGEHHLKLSTSNALAYSTDDVGPGIVFTQRYWNASGVDRPTGAIYGVKTTGNGSNGGGLTFAYQNSSQELTRSITMNHDGRVGIGTTDPAEKLDVQGSAVITGLTYGIKSTGTLGSDRTESWYRLLIGGIRDGASAIRTKCKLHLRATGLHQTLTFDFNHMINLTETSGNSFNLLANDHYISRVGITKLRLADAGSNQFALDMYIDHDIITLDRVWTVTLYTEGGSLISEATTFLEKITATPSASIELDTDTSIFGIVGNTTSKTLVMHENGRIGIGTTNPGQVLHVAGGNIRVDRVGECIIENKNDVSDFGTLTLTSGYRGGSSRPKIQIHGYKGQASVNGDNLITFHTGGSERMKINQSGNVGIGLTNPSSTLHVSGSARVTSTLQTGYGYFKSGLASGVSSGTGIYTGLGANAGSGGGFILLAASWHTSSGTATGSFLLAIRRQYSAAENKYPYNNYNQLHFNDGSAVNSYTLYTDSSSVLKFNFNATIAVCKWFAIQI